ncbi:MAG: energy transducer TonB [Gammaproteobacteria bacterium]|nr:energy transducer TonB [Gammaproteobacteria bacterium]
MLVRYAFGVVLGAVATFLLFMLMQAVIANPEAATDTGVKGRIVDFVRVQEDQEVQVKKRKPPPPPPVDEPPPSMPKPTLDSNVSVGMEIGLVDVDIDVDVSGTGYSSDGEYLPIVKVAPIYPRRAQSRGIEGYVLLEFTVTTTGSVRDPSVIEAKPPGVFDRSAINAALKFKYKPKVVDGEPIEVAGVRNLITFQLED